MSTQLHRVISTVPDAVHLMATRFMPFEQPCEITPFGSGHINDTYLVVPEGSGDPFILQRINHTVFPDVGALMQNIGLATNHLEKRSAAWGYQPVSFITTDGGSLFTGDATTGFWRAMRLIGHSVTHDRIATTRLAREAGMALGAFHAMFNDFDADTLAPTLPHFHHLGRRLTTFREILKTAQPDRLHAAETLIAWSHTHGAGLLTIDHHLETGLLPLRVVHNDPKANNILFSQSGKALCLIDLDTVMPGTLLHDFGDAIRTSASMTDEDQPDTSRCGIDLNLFEAYLQGYLQSARPILTTHETELLAEAPLVLTFTIGLRFLTDYLAGDVYYKTAYTGHNLVRAKAQFAQANDMLFKLNQMKLIVKQSCNP